MTLAPRVFTLVFESVVATPISTVCTLPHDVSTQPHESPYEDGAQEQSAPERHPRFERHLPTGSAQLTSEPTVCGTAALVDRVSAHPAPGSHGSIDVSPALGDFDPVTGLAVLPASLVVSSGHTVS